MNTHELAAAVIARNNTYKDRILRKLAAVVVLASVALAGCAVADTVTRDDTEQRVATVRAAIEAQIKDGHPLPMNGIDE